MKKKEKKKKKKGMRKLKHYPKGADSLEQTVYQRHLPPALRIPACLTPEKPQGKVLALQTLSQRKREEFSLAPNLTSKLQRASSPHGAAIYMNKHNCTFFLGGRGHIGMER